MHVVVRADGGPDVGYGHLVRTGALASELVERGHRVTYATATPDRVVDVVEADVTVAQLSARSDVEALLDRLPDDADAVVLDSYAAGVDSQRALRDRRPLAVVSDDADGPVCADLLVNPNLHAPALAYEVRGPEPRRCLGPDYALLREAIARHAEREPPWRDRPERAVVTMGGSDPTGVTPAVVRAFDGFDLRVEAVVGPGFDEALAGDVARAADEVTADVAVVRDPHDLPERMFEADVAVATASTTAAELLALGTPIVSCAVADNQRPVARALRERDLATVVDPGDGTEAFARAIEAYVASPSLRRERRRAGRQAVDGRGAERVADEVERLPERRSEPP